MAALQVTRAIKSILSDSIKIGKILCLDGVCQLPVVSYLQSNIK